jgi:acetolactate synthase I/II/III large subunit
MVAAAERATSTAAEAAIEALAREGVDHVFGLPGTTTMHLLDALARRDDVRFVSTRHEQVAGFMADGFARASGRPGVCMASRGPGAANLAIALHNAYGESVPVVALIGQVDDEIVYREAFEEIDLVALFEPLTKWALEVHDAARVPELVQRAVQVARCGRPRPVMASLPLDVQTRAVREPDFRPPINVAPAVPPADGLTRAAALLAGAERPVILAGGGAERAGAREAVSALAERLGAPVAASWQRKSAFPDSDPAFVGVLGFGALEVTERSLAEADVVLALGCRLSQFTSRRWTLPSPAAELIQVDVDAEELGRAHPVAVALQGDARAASEGLAGQADRAAGEAGGAGHDRTAGERRARLADLRRDYEDQSRPPDPASGSSAALVDALRGVRDRHDPVFLQDAPTFGVWMQRYLPVERAGSYFGNAGGAMGWGFPAALGAQLARPGERVVAVVGDGSFWMVAQDLETAVRESIPVVTVVANNFAYGNTRDRQRADHGGRMFGVYYDNPDFAAFARLLGAHGEWVERPVELEPALERALASGLPAVVDVIQDRDEGLPHDVRPPVAGKEDKR